MVSFHAHPDDESMLTAGVLARASSEGHRTILVVATEGEAGLTDSTMMDDVGSLGALRRAELDESARILGVTRVEWLGFGDSGSDPEASPRAGSLAATDTLTAASRLAEILLEEQADVLTSYDSNGGYGHPDHIAVHKIGRRAVQLVDNVALLEATFDRGLFTMGLELARQAGLGLPPGLEDIDTTTLYASPEQITHRVDVSSFLDAKRASMQAHVSQTRGATGELTTRTLELFLSLPEELFAFAFGTEYFISVGPEPADTTGREALFGTPR